MQVKAKDFKDFFTSLNKFSKWLIHIGTALIIALLCAWAALWAVMLAHGQSIELWLLSRDILNCAADCFPAVYIPAMLVELIHAGSRL